MAKKKLEGKVVRTPTLEDFESLVEKLSERDIKFMKVHEEDSYFYLWDAHKENTCVRINNGSLTYGPKSYYESRNMDIMKAKDFYKEWDAKKD